MNQFSKSDAAFQKFYGLSKFLNIASNFSPIICPVLSSPSVNPDSNSSKALPRFPIPISPPSPYIFYPACISCINFSYYYLIFFIASKSSAYSSPSALSSLVKLRLPSSNSFISLSMSWSMSSTTFSGSAFSGSADWEGFYFY